MLYSVVLHSVSVALWLHCGWRCVALRCVGLLQWVNGQWVQWVQCNGGGDGGGGGGGPGPSVLRTGREEVNLKHVASERAGGDECWYNKNNIGIRITCGVDRLTAE